MLVGVAAKLCVMGRYKVLVPLLVAVVLGSVVGCAEEPSSTGSPERHMIDHGGHELAFYVTPGTLPAIVLDSGGGLDASYCNKLVPALA